MSKKFPVRKVDNKVWVEVRGNDVAYRIFANKKAAAANQFARNINIRLMDKARATEQIRRQVFERDEWLCVKCGETLVWERGHVNSLEMDERQSKGQLGEVSVENCQSLCHVCHVKKHGRVPAFSASQL